MFSKFLRISRVKPDRFDKHKQAPQLYQVETLEERLVLSSLNGVLFAQPSHWENPTSIAETTVATNATGLNRPFDPAQAPGSSPSSQPDPSDPAADPDIPTADQSAVPVGYAPGQTSILPAAFSDEPLATPFDIPPVATSLHSGTSRSGFHHIPVTEMAAPGEQAGEFREAVSDGVTIQALMADTARMPVISSENSPNSENAAWFIDQFETVTVRYDFRDMDGFTNTISAEQQALAEKALEAWSAASGERIQFVRDTEADIQDIVNIGVGDLALLGATSQKDGILGLSQIQVADQNSSAAVRGIIWLDQAERWENNYNNGDVAHTYDFFTVVAHEAGHISGLEDIFKAGSDSLMARSYQREHNLESIDRAVDNAIFMPLESLTGNGADAFVLHAMGVDPNQLQPNEVQDLLKYGSQFSIRDDAIIAIVDRNGNILGVRAEQAVLDTFVNPQDLAFAIDGAVAKARTAAMFSNGDPENGTFAPITSRLVRFISQSTVTEREVNSNPNIIDPDSTERGPGFVAPVGLGGHFPPDIPNTPQVDLFGIEHTNRDSIIHPGDDGIKGTADDVTLRGRFNVDPAFVPVGKELAAPESYGFVSGMNPGAQSRGIATLPGGIPLFRDTDGDGIGDTLIGGVGVFFPGEDGYASFEQGFVNGDGKTTFERTNAELVLEAEVIALAIAGGSTLGAAFANNPLAKTAFAGNPVATLDLPFGRLDLVGVQLSALGPTAGYQGVNETVAKALQIVAEKERVLNELMPADPDAFTNSGADQIVLTDGDLNNNGVFDRGIDYEDPHNPGNFLAGPLTYREGLSVPEGYLVEAHGSTVNPELTQEVVEKIIADAIYAAEATRAAIRLEAADQSPGARTRMVFAVTDTNGEVLALYRMKDATTFSIDVAVAKARNVAYYSDPADVLAIDKVQPFDGRFTSPDPIDPATAFTNRTFRYLSEPRFPDGIDNTPPGPFSILNNPSIDPRTGENIAGPAPASSFTSIVGYDAFNPNTNFRDPGDAGVAPAAGASQKANQNGVVFFPGSTPLYINGQLVGGFGVSGDGVDQDDVVTFLGAMSLLPDGVTVPRADQVFVDGVRLPYQKFLRNPFG